MGYRSRDTGAPALGRPAAVAVIGVSLGLILGGFFWVDDDVGNGAALVDRPDTPDDQTYEGRLGLLIAAHGMPGQWNERVRRAMEAVDTGFPTEIGFLEYSPVQTIDGAVEKLLDEGTDRIVAVPLFICGNSSHTPEVIEAIADSVNGRAEVFVTESMDDHELIEDILVQHGLDLCGDDPYSMRDTVVNPKDASLILFAHGDNQDYFKSWEKLAGNVTSDIIGEGIFKEVMVAWAGGDNLKDAVEDAGGHPLVIPWMVAYSEYSDADIRKQLMGMDYQYNGKHLVDHPNSIRWVEDRFGDYANRTVWTNTNRG